MVNTINSVKTDLSNRNMSSSILEKIDYIDQFYKAKQVDSNNKMIETLLNYIEACNGKY